MSPDQFQAIIDSPREAPALEFKGPGLISDQNLFFKVLKGMIAMSNRGNGGTIILGIADDKTSGNVRLHQAIGLSDEELASWDSDQLADKLARYTDPLIVFDAETHTYERKTFLVIEIREFYDSPVFAVKQVAGAAGKPPLLKDGGVYIRSTHKPETKVLSNSAEMRALLDIALSKYMRRQLSILAAARMHLVPANDKLSHLATSTSAAFEEELDNNEPALEGLIQSIQARGYWRVVVRPDQYVRSKLSSSELRPILEQSSVSLRGWNFPHIEYGSDHDFRTQYWWGQGISWGQFQESWRFFRSGQFEYLGGLHEDWVESGQFVEAQTGKIPLWGSIYRFLEIYEFASRLASSNAATPQMLVQVELMNIKNRQLYQDNYKKTGIRIYKGPIDFRYPPSSQDYIIREELLADPATLAAQATSEFLDTFGFQVSPDGVKIWQSESVP